MQRSAPYSGDTLGGALATAIAADATRPLLTYYDDMTGERTELSGATLDNWVAKTANLLVDGCGLGTGTVAAVALPPHWQSAAVLLGCWSAGVAVSYGRQPADVSFTAVDHLDESAPAPERFVLALSPMALPLPIVPAGFVDFVAEVRGHGDRFPAYPLPGDTPAVIEPDGTTVTHDGLLRRARARAGSLGVGPGARVLVDGAAHPDPVDWLLAPLVAGASTVLCGRLDRAKLAARAQTERVTLTLAG
jgi:uncharacterized protein (TIGR03089 family)